MSDSSHVIERILSVDDDSSAREGFGYPLEELGITPVPEPGPITDLQRFVEEVPGRAQAVLCDYRLKTDGRYSSVNGDELVAACYRRRIPGLLCTQYSDVFVEVNRRFIPVLLTTSSPTPRGHRRRPPALPGRTRRLGSSGQAAVAHPGPGA